MCILDLSIWAFVHACSIDSLILWIVNLCCSYIDWFDCLIVNLIVWIGLFNWLLFTNPAFGFQLVSSLNRIHQNPLHTITLNIGNGVQNKVHHWWWHVGLDFGMVAEPATSAAEISSTVHMELLTWDALFVMTTWKPEFRQLTRISERTGSSFQKSRQF